MADGEEIPRIPIQLSRDVLVASVQVDLDEAVMTGFRQDLLERIHASGASGVILDLSGLDALDSHEFEELRRLIEMTRVMGARPVLVGLNPGIVSSLVMTDVNVDGLEATHDLDNAFRLLEPAPLEEEEEEDVDEDTDEEPEPDEEAEEPSPEIGS